MCWRGVSRARSRALVTQKRKGPALMKRSLYFALTCLLSAPALAAQEFSFPEAAVTDAAALSKAMPELAKQVMAVYKDGDRAKLLDNLFRLQAVGGQYGDALRSSASLRELLRTGRPPIGAWVNVQYDIYARAKAKQDAQKLAFNDAYTQSFQDVFGKLDDRTSALVIRALTMIDPADTQQDLQSDLQKQKGKTSISLPDAVKLVSDYQVAE